MVTIHPSILPYTTLLYSNNIRFADKVLKSSFRLVDQNKALREKNMPSSLEIEKLKNILIGMGFNLNQVQALFELDVRVVFILATHLQNRDTWEDFLLDDDGWEIEISTREEEIEVVETQAEEIMESYSDRLELDVKILEYSPREDCLISKWRRRGQNTETPECWLIKTLFNWYWKKVDETVFIEFRKNNPQDIIISKLDSTISFS